MWRLVLAVLFALLLAAPVRAQINVQTRITDSASLRTLLTDETGTGLAVFATSPAFSGLTTFGTGDTLSINVPNTPQLLDMRRGTAGAPDTVLGPLLKVSRTLGNVSTITGDGAEELGAIAGYAHGTATTTQQPVGVFGGTTQAGNGDSVGGYFNSKSSGTGVAIGVFAIGSTLHASGEAVGAEIDVENSSGVASTWNTLGLSAHSGIWLNALGDADSAVAFALGNGFGYQFDVGIGVTAQAAGGKTGPIRTTGSTLRDLSHSAIALDIQGVHATAALRDTSVSAIGVDIQGTHATAAIQVGASAGNVGIGAAPGTDKLRVESASDLSVRIIKTGGSDFYITAGTSYTAFTNNTYTNLLFGTGNSTRLTIDGNGNVQVALGYGDGGPFIVAPRGTQTIGAGDTIVADACGSLKRLDAGGAVTTSTTATFTAPAASNAGCVMVVCNVDSTDTITLDNNAAFKSTAGANVALLANSCIPVASDGAVWRQTGPLHTAT